MTTSDDPTMAARVPADLRDEALALVGTPRFPDRSSVLRIALRELVDRENGRANGQPATGLFAPREGTTRRHDRSTSRKAAADTAPRTGTGRRRALEVIVRAGLAGATTDEVVAMLERLHPGQRIAVNGVARRVTDLLEAGAIEEARCNGTCAQRECDGSHVATRPTRHGSAAIVWTATDKGRRWLEETDAA